MVKVLLIFEEYSELSLAEVYLKKVGFDAVGISNEVLLGDKLLSFNPEIVVAYGKGPKVSSLSVGQKLKESFRYHGKVILVVPKNVRPSANEMIKVRMDAMMEAPLNPERFIQTLARLSNQSATLYMDKFNRIRQAEPELDKKLIMVTGSVTSPVAAAGPANGMTSPGSSKAPPLSDPDRIKKYTELVKDIEIDVKTSTHHRKDTKEKQAALKKGWDFDKLEEQDALKRQFAEALFKKK